MAFQTTANSGTAAITSIDPKQRLPVAYSKKFLERLEELNDEVFTKYVTEYPVMGKAGDQVVITITPTLSRATTPLSESQLAKNTTFQTTNVTMELEFYGNDIGWSTLFDLTAIDVVQETHSMELAMNARETMTALVVAEMDGAALVDWGTNATFGELVAAVRTLKGNKVRGFPDLGQKYVGAIGPFTWEDLTLEGGASYKDHYQTKEGSDVLAEGQLSKPIAGVQLFVTTSGTVISSSPNAETNYFWGQNAMGTTQMRSTVAGASGKSINMPGVSSSLIGYLVPANAHLGDPYALQHHSVWRGGPVDWVLTDSNRLVRTAVDQTSG